MLFDSGVCASSIPCALSTHWESAENKKPDVRVNTPLSRPQASIPLASVQREIWFEQTLYPDTPVYTIGGYSRITGPLDRELFRQAIVLLVQETDVLRLNLTEQDGVPFQSFPEMPQVELELYDCSG